MDRHREVFTAAEYSRFGMTTRKGREMIPGQTLLVATLLITAVIIVAEAIARD